MAASIGGLIGYGGDEVNTYHTTITFAGAWHLTGATVSVQMLGQDCGDFTIAADGTVKVPLLGATVGGVVGVVDIANIIADSGKYDDQEQVVPIELKSAGIITYPRIPVVIGTAFVSQGQRLRLMSQPDAQTRSGPVLAETRRGYMYGVLVKDAVVASFGTSLTPTPTGDMISEVFSGLDGYAALPRATGFDGVWWQTWDTNYDFDNMFCWQVDRPWPFVLCATTAFIRTEER